MASTTYSNFRKNLKYFMDKVIDDSGSLVITRQGKDENVVLIPESEWDSIQETLYVMSDPVIMEGIQQGKKDVEEGRVTGVANIEEFKKAMRS